MPTADDPTHSEGRSTTSDVSRESAIDYAPSPDLTAAAMDILRLLGQLTGADSVRVEAGDPSSPVPSVSYNWGSISVESQLIDELRAPFVVDEDVSGHLVIQSQNSAVRWGETEQAILSSMAAMVRIAISRDIAEAKLTRSHQELTTIFERAPIALLLVDRSGRVLQANQQSTKVLHKHPTDVEGTNVTTFVFAEDLPPLLKMWNEIIATVNGVRTLNEVRLITPEGPRWHRIGCTVTRSEGGDLVYVTMDMVDIDDAKRLAFENDRTQRSLGTLIDNLPDAVLKMDHDFNVIFSNPAARNLAEWARSADGPMSVLGWPEPPPDQIDDYLETMWKAARTGAPERIEHTLGPEGDARWYETSFVPEIGLDGSTESLLFVTHDIHERRLQRDGFAHRATHDDLTGLPNRELFLERLSDAAGSLGVGNARGERSSIAVLFFDLDRFKVINDSLGHIVGDQLLIQIAGRLTKVIRPGDVVSRLGSDEFTLLIHNTGPTGALALAERIKDSIREPIEVEGREFILTASMGLVTTDVPESATDLLRWADAAMYKAKEQGRNCVALFDERLRTELTEHLELDQLLRTSLSNGELSVHYQPEVNLGTGRIIGVEALVRWEHPTRGMIPAGDFVPLAEDNGMIAPIGQWVLESACAQAMTWHSEGLVDDSFVLRVNLSTRQLAIPSLIGDIQEVLLRTGLPPTQLCLEVTETALMRDVDHSLQMLNELSSLGLSLAVDDFGTGYSSLSSLKQFPLDVLKIDMSFVDGLPTDANDMAIVSTIILLANSLGLTTTAEGVEHEGQREALLQLGCTSAQGYMFARPVPAEELAALLICDAALPVG